MDLLAVTIMMIPLALDANNHSTMAGVATIGLVLASVIPIVLLAKRTFSLRRDISNAVSLIKLTRDPGDFARKFDAISAQISLMRIFLSPWTRFDPSGLCTRLSWPSLS